MNNFKNESSENVVLKNIAMIAATMAIITGITLCGNLDSDNKSDEDNPYLGYYFDYKTHSYLERPYKLGDIDMSSRAFKSHAEDFNKCKQSCYAQKLVPQDYFHDYTGRCKCLTVKDKIAHQQKARSR
jgi:hypothetical protein